MKKSKTRCGFVAVVGSPNAGKSTLVNTLTGQKVSIVTPKAQTTRNRIRGIKIHNDSQIIFVDTPGIFKISGKLDNRLNRSIIETARNAFEGMEYVMLMIDSSSRELTEDDMEVINFLKGQTVPKILVLNKIDVVDKEKLLQLSENLHAMIDFEKTFMISATKEKGTNDILDYLAAKLPESPFHYPADVISDFPARMLAAEITREKLFMNLRQEIPYNTMVETEKFEENSKQIKIYQVIYTSSNGHKGIILGNKGAFIKRIGEQSRRELTQLLGKKVHLFLHVKVKETWMEDKSSYLISGMDYKN